MEYNRDLFSVLCSSLSINYLKLFFLYHHVHLYSDHFQTYSFLIQQMRVYINYRKLSPMVSLIRSLFTLCIVKGRGGKIRTSTPAVMPILKIKSKQRQTLHLVSHVWRLAEKCKGKVMSCFQVWACGVFHYLQRHNPPSFLSERSQLILCSLHRAKSHCLFLTIIYRKGLLQHKG